jgi:hypothetical protein
MGKATEIKRTGCYKRIDKNPRDLNKERPW